MTQFSITAEQLLPCPFCPDGGKPYKSDAINESTDNGSCMVYVGCAKCGVCLKAGNFPQMDGSWRMSKDIVGIWNTRTPAPVDAGLVEALEKIKFEYAPMYKAHQWAVEALEAHRKALIEVGGGEIRP